MTRQNLERGGTRTPGAVSLSRLLRGAGVVALVLSAGGALVGCALVGDGAQSGQSGELGQSGAAGAHAGAGEIPASGGEQAMAAPAEKVMSGEYEVGPDGKLLNPNRNLNLTPPQLPELVKEHSKEGAEAFARYYIELLPYMWVTGDTKPIDSIAHSDSQYCKKIARAISEDAANGGWTKPFSYEIRSLGPAFEIPGHPGIWNVDADVTRTPLTSYHDGKLYEKDRQDERALIQIQYKHGQWRMWEMGRE